MFKTRLVAKGFHQTLSTNFFENFSLVAKIATIRIILRIAVMSGWFIRQIDINNAFFNGESTNAIYMHQPKRRINLAFPYHVYRLDKALYGLK